MYVVNGAGGNREGNQDPDPASWVAFHSAEIGFGYMTISGASSLLYEFVAANGTTLFQFEITK